MYQSSVSALLITRLVLSIGIKWLFSINLYLSALLVIIEKEVKRFTILHWSLPGTGYLSTSMINVIGKVLYNINLIV